MKKSLLVVLLVVLAVPVVASSDDFDGHGEGVPPRGERQIGEVGVQGEGYAPSCPPPAYTPPTLTPDHAQAPFWAKPQNNINVKVVNKITSICKGAGWQSPKRSEHKAAKKHRSPPKPKLKVEKPPPAKPPSPPATPRPLPKDEKPTSAVTTDRGEGNRNMWSWILPVLVLLAGLCLIVGLTIGLSNLYYGRGVNWFRNQDNQRIRSRRTFQGLQDPPAYAGPAKGKGGSFHYEGDHLVGWEHWETPIEPIVREIAQGTPAVVISQTGQATQVITLPLQPRTQQAQPGQLVSSAEHGAGREENQNIDHGANAAAGANVS